MNGDIRCPNCDSPRTRPNPGPPQHVCEDCGQAFQVASSAKRVFISYGHDEHASLAVRLKRDLVAQGYEVWFDADRLKPGGDWEVYIERGLDWVSAVPGQGRVVLLMTPHSVRRPDGYCLNEIARALIRQVSVLPVMVVWCEPPLSICRIQWLDMRDCSPVEQHGEHYEAKLEALVGALEQPRVGFEDRRARLLHLLRPLTFGAEIAEHVPHFHGRQWVLEKIDDWLKNPEADRVFWLLGKPGVGKSALAAWLCHHRREVAAYHFCRHGHTQKADPKRCVLSIAYQLSTQFPDYLERLNALELESLAAELNAPSLFDTLVVQPLAADFPRPAGRALLVIDALDEATQEERNELAAFLASDFPRTPDWVRLLVTSCPDPIVAQHFRHLDPIVMEKETDLNEQDLRGFLQTGLPEPCRRSASSGRLVERIVELAEGVFLYVHWVVRELKHGRLSAEHVDQFPQGLGAVYAGSFHRRFKDLAGYAAAVRPGLELLAAAREPVTADLLRAVLGWNTYEVREFVRSLGSILGVEEGALRPFHHSVHQWLTDSEAAGPFFVDEQEGHRRLADYCRAGLRGPAPRGGEYAVRHAAAHFRRMGYFDELFGLLQNDACLAALLAVTGPEVLRNELADSWAAAVRSGEGGRLAEEYPASAAAAEGLYLAGSGGDVPGAIAALDRARRCRSPVLAAMSWNTLCWLHKDHAPLRSRRRLLRKATGSLRRALARVADQRCAILVAEANRTVGWALKDTGSPGKAETAFRRALDLCRRFSAPAQAAWSARDLGCLYRDSGRTDQARQMLEVSEEGFRRLHDDRNLARTLRDLGVLYLDLSAGGPGDRERPAGRALDLLREAGDLAGPLQEHDLGAWIDRYRGLGTGLQGRLKEGREMIRAAMDRFCEFMEANRALSEFCIEHLAEIRRPHELEYFGHLPAPKQYSRMLKDRKRSLFRIWQS